MEDIFKLEKQSLWMVWLNRKNVMSTYIKKIPNSSFLERKTALLERYIAPCALVNRTGTSALFIGLTNQMYKAEQFGRAKRRRIQSSVSIISSPYISPSIAVLSYLKIRITSGIVQAFKIDELYLIVIC